MTKSSNGNSEIVEELPQPQESQLDKFKNQYQLTLNFFLNRKAKREDIIKALPHTLEIIDTLADKLLDPTKKIEFKELSKLTTKELKEIKTSLEIIDQRTKRPQTPTFDAVKNKCAEIIDTLITNKEEKKKNRFSFFSAVRRRVYRHFLSNPEASDLSDNNSLKIDQKLTDIKNILTLQNEIDRTKTDEQIANILKDNTDKLRNLNAVGAQNSGGNSSGGNSSGDNEVEVKLTFNLPKTRSYTGPAKSEPEATLAGPNLTEPSLTPQQIAIAKELPRLNPGNSTPSNQPPKLGLPTLTGRRRVGSLPQRTVDPSKSPSLPKRDQSLAAKIIEQLREHNPDSPAANELKKTTKNLMALERKKINLQLEIQAKRGKRGGRAT